MSLEGGGGVGVTRTAVRRMLVITVYFTNGHKSITKICSPIPPQGTTGRRTT